MEKKLPRVLISDKLSLSSIDIFKKQNIDTDYKPGISNIDLLGIIDQYDGLAIRSSTQVTQEVFEKAKKLKIVGRAGIGTDIDRRLLA